MKLLLPFDRQSLLRPLCSESQITQEFTQLLHATLSADPNFKKHKAKVTREVSADLRRPDGWFEQALREKYSCILDSIIDLFSSLNGPDSCAELAVFFYTSFFSRIPSGSDLVSRPLRTVRGAFEAAEVEPVPFWRILTETAASETVFVLVSRDCSCFDENLIKLYVNLCKSEFPTISFIPLDVLSPEQTLVLAEFAGLTGGQVFPDFSEEMLGEAVKEFLGDVVAATLRREVARRRPSVHGFSEARGSLLGAVAEIAGDFRSISGDLGRLGLWALRLLTAEAAVVSRRWARGLRVFREAVLGLRDVTFFDPGDLGLEVASNPWRVLATVPPASSLGLARDTQIAAIHGERLDDLFTISDLLRALARRPLVITFRLVDPCVSSDLIDHLIARLAVDVSAEVLERRVGDPWSKLPSILVPNDAQATVAAAPSGGASSMSSLASDCSIEEAIASSTLALGFDATARVVDVRRVDEASLLHSAQPWDEIRTLADSVTPALFAVTPSLARKLRNEGVAVETLFLFWLLRQVFDGRATADWWTLLAVFVLRVARLDAVDLDLSTKHILAFPMEVGSDEIREAQRYGAELASQTKSWDEAWRVFEFLDPGERGVVEVDASRDIEELDRCYKHRFFRVFSQYVSVCGVCPPVPLPSLRCWKVLKAHFLTFPENYGYLCLYSDGYDTMYTTDGHVYVGPDFQKVVPESLLPKEAKKLYMFRDWCVALDAESLTFIHVPSERTVRSSTREVGLCVVSSAPMQHGMFGLRNGVLPSEGGCVLEFVEIYFSCQDGQSRAFPEILDFFLSQEDWQFGLTLVARPEVLFPVPFSKNLLYRVLGGLRFSIQPNHRRPSAEERQEIEIQEEQSFVIDDDVVLLDSKRRLVFTTKFLD